MPFVFYNMPQISIQKLIKQSLFDLIEDELGCVIHIIKKNKLGQNHFFDTNKMLKHYTVIQIS